MTAADYDEAVVELRFRHYQQRLMDRINKVVVERKSIKTREAAKEQLSHLYASRESSKMIGRSHSQAALPAIKHQRHPAGNNAFKSEFTVSAANSPTLGHSISVS